MPSQPTSKTRSRKFWPRTKYGNLAGHLNPCPARFLFSLGNVTQHTSPQMAYSQSGQTPYRAGHSG